MNLYLASTSPRRKQLLKQMGVKFRVLAPDYEEKNEGHMGPSALVRKHALGKALSVVRRVKNGRILSADSIVYCCGKIIGKPKDKKDALSTLTLLQGRWQLVLSGVAMLDVKDGCVVWKKVFVEKTRVKLKKLTRAQILDYVKKTNPYDKAGGFGIQSKKFPVLEKVEGSILNAVGLPVETLKPFMVR